MPSGDPVGYGEWGVIDAFRRAKPETFLVWNIYAPVKLTLPTPGSSWAPNLLVENRNDFSDLSEVEFSWLVIEAGVSGTGNATGRPHTVNNTLVLQGLPPSPMNGTMQINATSARGFLLNSWTFPLALPTPTPPPPPLPPTPSLQQLPDGWLWIQDAAGAFSWFISPSGAMSGNTSAGGLLVSAGPALMVLPINSEGGTQLTEGMPPILPFNDVLGGWILNNRTASIVGSSVVVTLQCTYQGSASGTYTMSFDGSARLTVDYAFTWTSAAVTPRQVGVVLSAPADLATVSWRRSTPWSTNYPADHIGRSVGDAVPANAGPAPGFNSSRSGPWCKDPSPLGDADFRSTRHNVSVYQLGAGNRALTFLSANGTQHGRSWLNDDGTVSILAADLSNEGGNPFSREAVLPHPVYSAGSLIVGAATFLLGGVL